MLLPVRNDGVGRVLTLGFSSHKEGKGIFEYKGTLLSDPQPMERIMPAPRRAGVFITQDELAPTSMLNYKRFSYGGDYPMLPFLRFFTHRTRRIKFSYLLLDSPL